ncbi:hypothetical protein C8Q75DRAFT_866623 [Abortiporus biennis]|nr:hypothetical protein C8Q75DRAFT_866623 [Abortiporus biennis]
MVSETRQLRFVYYCSGHGYGHATRVSAFASHLLRLNPQPIVHIVSSAPKHVFADSLASGALYRHADIDPIIVQPLAYRVDRKRSVEVLKSFLGKRDLKTIEESEWLRNINADCVLSDAAFLGCCAANTAGIPSVLITNFSFDSVYSYLSTSFVDQDDSPPQNPELLQVTNTQEALAPDTPIPWDELRPLVEQILSGYRCADLLVRLPGAIPIPSFAVTPSLPSPRWVDLQRRTFIPTVEGHLTEPPSVYELHPPIPFPPNHGPKVLPRSVLPAPLLVRSPDPSVYTEEGRRRLLNSIGVPHSIQTDRNTKILLVSFGGQIFHKPHSHSRTPSQTGTPVRTGSATNIKEDKRVPLHETTNDSQLTEEVQADALSDALRSTILNNSTKGRISEIWPNSSAVKSSTLSRMSSLRTRSRLMVAGAPPAAVPNSPSLPVFSSIIPPTPSPNTDGKFEFPMTPKTPIATGIVEDTPLLQDEPQLFPDDSWIAIICGVSKDWGSEDGEEMPERFFVAPKDVYMPDLTAVADVLLGKLGYGTVSECVDSCTPFVFVPRPLFIEEYGLRMLLHQEGVGVELSRQSYESGEWAVAVEEAWNKGREAKEKKRLEGENGKRKEEGLEMAKKVVGWVEEWKVNMSIAQEITSIGVSEEERLDGGDFGSTTTLRGERDAILN